MRRGPKRVAESLAPTGDFRRRLRAELRRTGQQTVAD